MTINHRQIPILPECPQVRPISGNISRSYPEGRQSFSRAYEGKVMTLRITTENPIPDILLAKLVTTMNSNDGRTWEEFTFNRFDTNNLICEITPKYPGLFSFRAEFSLDNGNSWLRDSIPDAWVLIDPPQVDDLRIYTMIPTVSGTVKHWKADLQRIKELGFNAVHLLPVTALDISESPYSAKDLFEIDNSYLDKESEYDGLTQLGEFIDEAIKLNIKLCFDIVLNHIGVQSTMTKVAPDWIVPDSNQPDGFHRARFWSNNGWCEWNDLVLINYEHPSDAIRAEIWSYMIEYTLFWAKFANDTGGFVRFDNLHSSDPDFVLALTTSLHSEYPDVGILAEYFTDETTLLHYGPKWGLNLNLATPWNYKFVPELRDYLKFIHRVSKHIRYFMPVTSHDSGSPAQEFGNVDSVFPRYVAAALLGTGATGIIQGVEAGLTERINFIGRKPLMFLSDEPKIARFITRVNFILTTYSTFRKGENCQFLDDGHPAIIAAFRHDTDMQAIGFLVVCNFDTTSPQYIKVDLSQILGTNNPVSCLELLSEKTINFPDTKLEILLPQCTAQVLMFSKVN
jgi:hypothetical protein